MTIGSLHALVILLAIELQMINGALRERLTLFPEEELLTDLTITSPADGSLYHRSCFADDREVGDAVAEASAAALDWGRRPVAERVEMIDLFVDAMCADADELAAMTAW